MNRDELLTKLAMELEEWPEFLGAERALGYRSMWKWKIDEWDFYLISIDMKHQIRKEHWLDRRTELINEPDDADAPDWARWKAHDSMGEWWWYNKKPKIYNGIWVEYSPNGNVDLATAGKIPAGHNWRDTLQRVNIPSPQYDPADVAFTPEPHGITGVKHRVKIRESGTCSDGTQCGTFAETAYCDECPNTEHHQHLIDSQRLDAQLKEAIRHGHIAGNDGKLPTEFGPTCTSEEDEEFNRIMQRQCDDKINPAHYRQGGIECIDAIKSATVGKTGIEAACVANVIKYLWRYEEKNGVEDVEKALWYLNRLRDELTN